MCVVPAEMLPPLKRKRTPMESSLKTIDPSTREATVELSKTDLDGYVTQAESSLGAQVSIPGFRKGKVPPDVLRKHVTEAAIREEALQIAVEQSLSQLIKKENLNVLDQSDFKIEKNTPTELVYKVKLTLFPAVTLGTYKGVTAEKRTLAVTDEELNRVLKDITASRAAIAQVDRPAQKGDQVEVDFTIKLNGAVIDGGESKNHPLIIGEKRFIPGFEEQLIGMKAGEEKTFNLAAPLDYGAKELAGKNIEFKAKMNLVEKREVPEWSD